MFDPDGSMETLYGGGDGRVFQDTLHWLQSPSDYLKMSGALAIGNFARSGKQEGYSQSEWFAFALDHI